MCPYTGPEGTEGVGICKAGTRTCNPEGSGYGECTGEVLPQDEVYANDKIDENCDGMTLSNNGLIARYFINAMDMPDPQGQVEQIEDAAQFPLPLPIIPAMTSGQLTWTDDGGHEGLQWLLPGSDGMVGVPIVNTKIMSLHGSKTATVEVVVNIKAVIPANGVSRVIVIGKDSNDRLSIQAPSLGEFVALVNGGDADNGAGSWNVPNIAMGGRVVLHLVIDTSITPEPLDRVKLYIDGVLIQNNANYLNLPDIDELVALSADQYFFLGNRDESDRSFAGTLYYAALYSAALSIGEVQNNAAWLKDNDDSPKE